MDDAYCSYYGRLEDVNNKNKVGHMILDDYIQKSIEIETIKFRDQLNDYFKHMKEEFSADIKAIKESVKYLSSAERIKTTDETRKEKEIIELKNTLNKILSIINPDTKLDDEKPINDEKKTDKNKKTKSKKEDK